MFGVTGQRLSADACDVCGTPVDLECSGDDRWAWVGGVGLVADQQDARSLDEQDVSHAIGSLGRKALRGRELLDREACDLAVLSNVLLELGPLLGRGGARRVRSQTTRLQCYWSPWYVGSAPL